MESLHHGAADGALCGPVQVQHLGFGRIDVDFAHQNAPVIACFDAVMAFGQAREHDPTDLANTIAQIHLCNRNDWHLAVNRTAVTTVNVRHV